MDKKRRDGQPVREEKKRGPQAERSQTGRSRRPKEREERAERTDRMTRPGRPRREERSSRPERRERPAAERQDVMEPAELPEDVLIGRNAVTEALKSGRGINKLLVANGDKEGSIREILALAHERGVLVQNVERLKIESLAGGLRHQGVLAYVPPVDYVELDEILARIAKSGAEPFLLLLDELEDPHNLGALLRTADAAGVQGVLIPKRRSCPLSSTVAKTSAGAVEYVPVARIGNVAQTLRSLKEKGYWVAGADMDGTVDYYDANFTGPLVLVVGSEGHGIGRLTKELCDFLVRLPMLGKINSLNASVAGSILMYEAMHQRLRAKK